MRFVFTPHAWEDYLRWQGTDRRTLKRANRLLDDIARDPFDGIGKPEPLRHALSGAWSRRTRTHRHHASSPHAAWRIPPPLRR